MCQLHCEHCLYKTTLAPREMDFKTTIQLLELFSQYGAIKMTILGGEPTLFGIHQNNRPLFDVIRTAKEKGYKYIRLDTNGQFDPDLLLNRTFQSLNNLSFSLDGYTAEINDKLRGSKSFLRTVQRMKEAIELGYYVTVTTCVHRGNIHTIKEIIDFVTKIGVKEINMHPLFKMGIERDKFSGNSHLQPKEWLNLYLNIRRNIEKNSYKIRIRMPLRFIKTTEYKKHSDLYTYCPVRMGERLLIHPNGQIRICALCIGSPYAIASYTTKSINFQSRYNEIGHNRLRRKPCMSQTRDFGDLTPLCISYKPFQYEYIWVTQKFDDKFTADIENRVKHL